MISPITDSKIAHMLQHRVAFDALKEAIQKRQRLRVGDDIHARHSD